MIDVIKSVKMDRCYSSNKICNCYYLNCDNITYISYSLNKNDNYILFEYENFINNKRIHENFVIQVYPKTKLKLIYLIKKSNRNYRFNDFLATYKDYIKSYE